MNLDFLSGIGDAIGSFFASPIVQFGLKAIGVYIVIVWLAAAFWAFRDMQLRTANPILPYLAAAFIVGFTPVLFVFAVLVYKIIRPQERLGEAYERGLAEEALLAEIDAIEHCATCGRKVHEDWILCPTCRTRLKRVCPNCSRLVGFEWTLCAWCGRDFERVVGAIGAVGASGPIPDSGPPGRGVAGRDARPYAGGPHPGPAYRHARDRRHRAQPDAAALNSPDPAARGDPAAPQPVGRGTFDLDGRAAPGLYVAGWGLAVAGLAALFVGLAGGGGGAGALLIVGSFGILALGLVAGAGAQGLQRAADGVVGYAGPSPYLVFAAAFTGSLFTVNVVAVALDALGIGLSDQAGVLISSLVSGLVSVGLIGILVIGPGALTWHDLGFRRPRPGEGSLVEDVAWGAALAIPAILAAAFLAALLIALLGATPEPTLPPTHDPAGAALNLIAAVAVAPFWEELFFRGFTTTAWARTAGPRAAIIRAGLFFALVHVLTVVGTDFSTGLRIALITFAIRIPVGLLLGWVFLRRRTLAAPIALHAVYNGIPLVLFLLAGSRVATG